jgi:hypothetical protein
MLAVADGVGVGVRVCVGEADGVTVRVAVGEAWRVGDGVSVGVSVGVLVGVRDGWDVGVGCTVAAGVGVDCGELPLSRDTMSAAVTPPATASSTAATIVPTRMAFDWRAGGAAAGRWMRLVGFRRRAGGGGTTGPDTGRETTGAVPPG